MGITLVLAVFCDNERLFTQEPNLMVFKTTRRNQYGLVSPEAGVRSLAVRVAAATVIAAGLVGGLAGCERTDVARDDTAAGTAKLRAGKTADAITLLDGVSKMSLDAGSTLTAKYTLGHAKLQQAQQKVGELEGVYVDVARLNSEIQQITSLVSIGNTMVGGYRQLNPTAARERIKQRIAEAQGGGGKDAWIEAGKLSLPSLSAAKQKVSQLQADVAKKQEEIKNYESQRATELTGADKLRDAVDALKGREALDAFTKASEARKKVTLTSSKIDVASSELISLQRDLEVAQGQSQIVEKYIGQLQQQDQALAAGYETVKKQIDDQLGVSKNAVAPTTDELKASMAAKAAELDAKLAEADKIHTEAAGLFEAAAAAYKAATDEASTLRSEVGERLQAYGDKSKFNKTMLDELQRVAWPSLYRTQQGIALKSLGDLNARRAAALSGRASLAATVAPVLQTAGIQVPDALQPGELTAKAKAASEAANTAYKDAYDQLEGAYSNTRQGQDPEKRRLAAGLGKFYTLYAWSQLLGNMGNTADAKAKLEEAKSVRDSLAQENPGRVPLLPGMEAAAPAPTETPATGPTSAPATVPAP